MKATSAAFEYINQTTAAPHHPDPGSAALFAVKLRFAERLLNPRGFVEFLLDYFIADRTGFFQ